MASPFDRLMNTIRPHLPGAIDDAIRLELFMTCNDFFTKSDTWRETLPFTILPNSRQGELMPFAGTIERLLYVYDGNGEDRRPVYGALLGEPDVSGAVPIILRRTMNDTGGLNAVVSLNVTDPVSRDAYPIVPSQIVKNYTEELIHGILSRMMSQPNKPYTNLTLAQFHLTKFKGGTARAKNAAKTGNTQGSQAWGFPQITTRRT